MMKTPPQVLAPSALPNFSYLPKCSAQIYRAQYTTAILVYLRGTLIGESLFTIFAPYRSIKTLNLNIEKA